MYRITWKQYFKTYTTFIYCQNANYLKEQKQNLDHKTALILMDFSENFTFTVQNEVQGYHWDHGFCTLHTAVIYYF